MGNQVARRGIDMAYAPATPQQLGAMLDAIGGTWALVYIGGPRNGGHGWTAAYVKACAAEGIASFLPCYVGRQTVPSLGLNDQAILTAGQGYADGQDAVACMAAYGWLPGCYVYLDVEYDTATLYETAAVAYCDGWCKAVRDGHYKPGVYGPLAFLTRIWGETNRPDSVYAADWVSSGLDAGLNPANIPGLPADVAAGARVWQYSGSATVLGLAADLDVANMPLNPAPGVVPITPPATPTAHSATDYAAAAWIATLDGLSSNIPIAQCVARKAQIVAWLKAHS